jgi:hypothetical protein
MSVRVAAALVAFALSASGAFAQDLDGPVNLPPAGFDGQQFVDNAGCAFARAGVSGTTVWVPRVDQSRNQICGLAPTFGATAVADVPAPPAPRSPVLAPQDAPGAPIPTVASTVPAAAPTPAPAPAVREPGRLTIAEACEGRTGIQPSLIDSRTGRPVDCGGVTQAAAPAPVAAEPARLTLAEACARQEATGTRLINSATGQPIVCAPAADAPRTVSLAAACAEQLATGVRRVNANTGEPSAGPPPTVTAQTPAPAPQAEPVYTTTVAATVARRLDPLSSATIPGTLALGPTAAVRPGDVLSAETISGVVTQIYYGPPPGYEPVWSDGRLNPNRGLPEIQAQVPVAANPPAGNLAPAAERFSTMNAPQPQAAATGGFVQIGTYGDPANAASAQATLQALGLPVAIATITRNGRTLQVVAAGPLDAADLTAALSAARAAGYGDAFIR